MMRGSGALPIGPPARAGSDACEGGTGWRLPSTAHRRHSGWRLTFRRGELLPAAGESCPNPCLVHWFALHRH